jgi:4-coumarate--CoA ligase
VGAMCSTANPAYTARELAHQLKDSTAVYVVTLAALLPVVREAMAVHPGQVRRLFTFDAPGEGAGDDVALFSTLLDNDGSAFPSVTIAPKTDVVGLPYSSGTTGLSKGVMLTHHNITSNIVQIESVFQLKAEDNLLAMLPFFHIYAQTLLLLGGPHYGCTTNVMAKFDPALFLKTIQDRKITVLHIVPPIVLFLAKHPLVDQFDLSSVHTILCGAAPLGEELASAVVERLKIKNLLQGYGMTEMSPVSHISPQGNKKYGAAGILVANTEAMLVDVDTQVPTYIYSLDCSRLPLLTTPLLSFWCLPMLTLLTLFFFPSGARDGAWYRAHR